MAIIYIESEQEANLGMAKECAETLTAAYPNHSWAVRIDGGVLFIKHFGISGSVGMCRHMSQIDHDAAVRKKEVIRAAGELLERAHLARGANTGDPISVLEGGEKYKWKPQLIHVPVIH